MRVHLYLLFFLLLISRLLYAHPIVQVNYKIQIDLKEKKLRISTNQNVAFLLSRHLLSNFELYEAEYKRLVALGDNEFLGEVNKEKRKILEKLIFGFDGQKVIDADISILKGTRKPISNLGDMNLDLNMHSDDLNAEIVITSSINNNVKSFFWQNDDFVITDIIKIKTNDSNDEAVIWVKPFETQEMILKKLPVSIWEVFSQYIYYGFIHILPLGFDHILFMLCLFFLFDGWKSILLQVSTFTVAHSITLILVTLKFISLKSTIVEPLIALSICVVGFENMYSEKVHRYRLLVIFLFGLLHGMGFASALKQLGLPEEKLILSLVSFNIGVEIGQLAVILMAYFLIGFWFFKKTWYRKRISIPCSILISIYAFYLFLTRLPINFS